VHSPWLARGDWDSPVFRIKARADSNGDCLTVHSAGSITTEKSNYLCDLPRFQHPVLWVERRALAPHLLDADAAPLGLNSRRLLGH
jgi:hypothetical protein